MNMQNVTVRRIDTDTYTRSFYTLHLLGVLDVDDIKEQYYKLHEQIKMSNEHIICERVFGRVDTKDVIWKIQKETLESLQIYMPPTSYVQGLPIDNSPFSGLEIHTVQHKVEAGNKLRYIHLNGELCGTEFHLDNVKLLHAVNLAPEKSRYKNESSHFSSEVENCFASVKRCINENHCSYTDIVRTWIYVNEIDKNYSEFNRVRRKFFHEIGIDYTELSNDLPASTCIEGISSEKGYCSMAMYCIDKKADVIVERIYNENQNEAEGNSYLYQPTFSRGILLKYSGCLELQISGTASINNEGETVYKDDPYNQIKNTLFNVSALLKQTNMNFGDICYSTCFFKEPQYYEIYKSIIKELNLENMPSAYVIGNVCRKDLLFEFDGAALRTQKGLDSTDLS